MTDDVMSDPAMTDPAPRKGMTASEIDAAIDSILAAATLEEKVAMMSGRGFFAQFQASGGDWGAEPYRAGGGCERLGVPALYFTDGPRGVARGSSTCFPVSMARGASWDRDLERRIGEVMGIEARAQGCNLSGAVCVNLLRHPAWGRAQETYGEDPHHVGEMGAALARGIQTHNVIATVKHFALNSIENARFKVDVRVDERTLREVYLPHFKRILDAGCASVMSAYNKMNGEHCGQNRTLLTDILRHEWGFEGFVHSDWVMGVYAPYGASAGLDVENPEPIQFGKKLVEAVEGGQIEPAVVNTACRRILSTLYRFAAAEDPLPEYTADLVARPGHVALAREAAEKSAVLLLNRDVLPLGESERIVVLGRLAEAENTGDAGSSRVQPPHVVTPLEGLRAFLGRPDLALAGDESDPAAAARAAGQADAAILIVGLTAAEEGEFIPGEMGLAEVETVGVSGGRGRGRGSGSGSGEAGDGSGTSEPAKRPSIGGDRISLRLPEPQVRLIEAVTAANPRTVVVIVAGSAVLIGEWSEAAGAVLQTFYSGMEGGHALARLLYGAVSPSGKLPFVVARDERDHPPFDRNADSIEYGPWHGYTFLDRIGREPHFAFGHGLSYTRFRYRALKLRRTPTGLEAQVSIVNEGERAGDEVAQLYVGFPGRAVERPRKLLRGFERVSLRPGEMRTVEFHIADADLSYWCPTRRSWEREPGEHRIQVGPSSRDEDLLSASISI